VGSASEVAVDVTEGGLGGTLGAKYLSPFIAPQLEAEQPDPVTPQFTALFVPVTVATTPSDPPISTFTPSGGEMLTVTPDFEDVVVGLASRSPLLEVTPIWVVEEMETHGEVLACEFARQWWERTGSGDAAPGGAVQRGIP
jgi:hypothetical protein